MMDKLSTSTHFYLEQVARALNESVMGFCALTALALAFAPELFEINPKILRFVDDAEWLIVGAFAIEYGVNLALVENRRQYLLQPSRLLDLAIVAAAIASLLPQVSDTLRSSPMLRVLRLVRAVLFGARAGGSITRRTTVQVLPELQAPYRLTLLEPSARSSTPATLTDLQKNLTDQRSNHWYHASGLHGTHLVELATAIGIGAPTLRSYLSDASYPRIEKVGRFVGLFLWVPRLSGSDIKRQAVFALSAGRALLTLSRESIQLYGKMVELPTSVESSDENMNWHVLLPLLRLTLNENAVVVGRLESEVRALEEAPVPNSQKDFFEKVFRIKKQLSTARADLWRLKGMLLTLADGGAGPDSFKNAEEDIVRTWASESDYLHETVENLRDGLLSIIELHLNLASFEMNKVMRILAVASVLGLGPAVVGGLFGMNIEGNPWPLTLPQITFLISIGMLLCLYIFLAKGWLR